MFRKRRRVDGAERRAPRVRRSRQSSHQERQRQTDPGPVRGLYAAGKKGRTYRPIPVLPIDADARKRIPRLDPLYASSKFYVAPGFRDVYASLDPWSTPLQRDETLYDELFRRWGNQRLRLNLLRMALPEGVLDDGGIVTGFLFFESPLAKESHVTLAAEFDASDGGGTVASIEIPFKVE